MVLFTRQVSDDDLKHMLLSPRATVVGDDNYTCCQSCDTSESLSKREEHSTSPKHAIANGFAIGHVPEIVTYTDMNGDTHTKRIHPETDLDDKLCAAISPVRPFGFVHAFTGGSQKSITGHFSFFQCKSESCRRRNEQV